MFSFAWWDHRSYSVSCSLDGGVNLVGPAVLSVKLLLLSFHYLVPASTLLKRVLWSLRSFSLSLLAILNFEKCRQNLIIVLCAILNVSPKVLTESKFSGLFFKKKIFKFVFCNQQDFGLSLVLLH